MLVESGGAKGAIFKENSSYSMQNSVTGKAQELGVPCQADQCF